MGFILLLATGALVLVVLMLLSVVRDARHPARATAGWALARGLAVDPAALGVAFEEVDVCGTRAWRLDGRDPEGVVTLVIHGWRRSRIDSLRRREPWLGVSRDLWVIDLAGHGESPEGPTTLGATDASRLVSFAQAILVQSVPRASPPRLLLVGHSMGAVIAVDLARQLDARRVAGVVAFAPYADLTEPLANRLAARGVPSRALALVAARVLDFVVGAPPPTRDSLNQLTVAGCPLFIAAARGDATVRAAHTEELARCASSRVHMSERTTHDTLGTELDRGDDTLMAQACVDFATDVRRRVSEGIEA